MRRFALPFLLLTCAGCASLGGPKPVTPDEALSIEYNLPVTSVRLSMDLTLVDCKAGSFVARPTIALQPASNPNKEKHERFRLHSTALSSWTRNKQVSVDLHPNGALKTVNGGVSDRTGAIVTNILKSALSILPMLDASATGMTGCNTATGRALEEVRGLQTRIEGLRSDLAKATPASAEEIRLAINALAAEVARLRTEQLLVSLTHDIEVGPEQPFVGAIQWTTQDLARWLEVPPGTEKVTNFQLAYCLTPASIPQGCPAPKPPPAPGPDKGERPKARCLPQCGDTIVLREPVNATIIVQAAGADFVRLIPGRDPVTVKANTILQKAVVPVAQWGTLSYVPLKVGFGGSNSFAVGLDEFGRRNSFMWKSDARAEGITGSVASIADATAKLEAGLRNQEVLEQQAEITRLQTLQNLNRLRFCREIIEAGGFTCPTG